MSASLIKCLLPIHVQGLKGDSLHTITQLDCPLLIKMIAA